MNITAIEILRVMAILMMKHLPEIDINLNKSKRQRVMIIRFLVDNRIKNASTLAFLGVKTPLGLALDREIYMAASSAGWYFTSTFSRKSDILSF